MRRPPIILIGIGSWLLAETLALMLVVHFVGWLGAIVLGILLSVAGVNLLSTLGKGAAQRLSQALAGGGTRQGGLASGVMLDGVLQALGAILMILPGFLSDLIGLSLAAPSVRQWLMRRFGGKMQSPRADVRPTNVQPDVIDLSPDDWSTVEPTRRQPRGSRTRGTITDL